MERHLDVMLKAEVELKAGSKFQRGAEVLQACFQDTDDNVFMNPAKTLCHPISRIFPPLLMLVLTSARIRAWDGGFKPTFGPHNNIASPSYPLARSSPINAVLFQLGYLENFHV